ncbi:IS4 family transposase [Prescottella subtropica]|uniref:IS4 family transposase n=1 Tax=Prescottella subtropica TaxID=2545757 RepID=UPI0019D619E0|nr:IS4 family transposase [Prescottella subtropica]
MSVQSVIKHESVVATGPFAPGHLGELTQIVPFEMVDAALESARATQARLRELPSRVVVYLLLSACLFPDIGYTRVWAKLTAGLTGAVAHPGSSALSQARLRIGAAPLRELFSLVKGPRPGAARWRGLLVCAIDGTSMFVPDTVANLGVYHRQTGGPRGDSGYPMVRMLAVVACGTRTIVDAVFGTYGVSEIAYAPKLFGCLRDGMLLLADRNFAVASLVEQIVDVKADLLIRCKSNRKLPSIEQLPDGSWLAPIGTVVVRVIDAEIVITPKGSTPRTCRYRLITTLSDHRRYPASELVRLYHQRWEIETTYLELKSTILGDAMLRARTPAGVTQEVYALLTTYQALRIAIADATTGTDIPPLRASFTVALTTARDLVVLASGVIAGTTVDLVGKIGRAVLADLNPVRRARDCPRVVKRAISKHRAKGDVDRTNYPAVDIAIHVLKPSDWTDGRYP